MRLPQRAEQGLRKEESGLRVRYPGTVGKKRPAPARPSFRASRGDPERRLTAWVPPCSRSVQRRRARIAPRFPRPSPAEGPRRSRQCRRDSQMLPKKAKFARRVRYLRRGEGSWAWTRRNLVCGRPGGTSNRSEVEVGDGRPDAGAKRPARKYRLSRDRSVELFRREDPLPEPFGALLRKEAWSEGPRVLLQRNLTVEFSADVR